MAVARLDLQRAARDTFARLQQAYPDAACALHHNNPFELVVAVVLSAQTTDVAVNRLLPELLGNYPDAVALAQAPVEHVEQLIHAIGMFRQKARNIVGLAQKLVADFGGEVPRSIEQLMSLPGVGRKSANVVLGTAFGIAEGIAVDTHVQRVTQRLGWTRHSAPADIEADLMGLFPRSNWVMLSHVVIFHGRRTCAARAPACDRCVVSSRCPSAFKAEDVGRKMARVRRA